VAAGVHHALFAAAHDRRLPGGEGHGGFLGDGQGVHVPPYHDGAARLPPAENAENAGSADSLADLEAELAKAVRDQGGGAPLLGAQLGVGVDVAPDGDERRGDFAAYEPEFIVHRFSRRQKNSL